MNYSAKLVKDEELGIEVISLVYDAADPTASMEVRIAPALGSNLYHFRRGDDNIIYCDKDLLLDRDWTGCFVLWPLPNRVSGKEFEFEGEHYSLQDIKRKRGNETLIHGLVDDKEWRVGEMKADDTSAKAITYIEVTQGSEIYKYFPFASRLELTYMLTASGIRISYTVTNTGNKNLPFGFALHPYFALLSGREDTLVTLPAETVMETDEELLPSGMLIPVQGTGYDLRTPTPVSRLSFDHVFTTLMPGSMPSIEYSTKGLRTWLRSSSDFTHLVLYTLEEPFICFENQTGSTDMINLHTKAEKEHDEALEKASHLLILLPGETHTGYIEYAVETL